MTHEGERISIVNIHQATARQPDLQRRVNTHIQAEMKKSEGRRRIMGGDLNGATSRTGDSISRKSHFEKINNQLQDFFQRTGGSLIQSHLSVYGTAHLEIRSHRDYIRMLNVEDIVCVRDWYRLVSHCRSSDDSGVLVLFA